MTWMVATQGLSYHRISLVSMGNSLALGIFIIFVCNFRFHTKYSMDFPGCQGFLGFCWDFQRFWVAKNP